MTDADGVPYTLGRSASVSDAKDASALGLTELFSFPTMHDGVGTVGLALRSTGELVAGRSATPVVNPDGSITLFQSQVGNLSAEEFHAFPVAPDAGDIPGGPRQVGFASVFGASTAWFETSSTDMYLSNWRIFANDGHDTRLLATSEELLDDAMPIVHGEPIPSIGPVDVYWQTPYQRGERGPDGHYSDFGVEIAAAPVDGSAPLRIVAKDAVLPWATDTGVVFGRVDGYGGPIEAGAYQVGSVENGHESTLVAGRTGPERWLSAVATVGDKLVWVVGDSEDATLFLLDRTTRLVDRVELHDANAGLTVNAPYIAWGNGSSNGDASEYLLDTDTLEIWKLAEQPGYSQAFVAGDYISYTTGKPDGTIVYHVARRAD